MASPPNFELGVTAKKKKRKKEKNPVKRKNVRELF